MPVLLSWKRCTTRHPPAAGPLESRVASLVWPADRRRAQQSRNASTRFPSDGQAEGTRRGRGGGGRAGGRARGGGRPLGPAAVHQGGQPRRPPPRGVLVRRPLPAVPRKGDPRGLAARDARAQGGARRVRARPDRGLDDGEHDAQDVGPVHHHQGAGPDQAPRAVGPLRKRPQRRPSTATPAAARTADALPSLRARPAGAVPAGRSRPRGQRAVRHNQDWQPRPLQGAIRQAARPARRAQRLDAQGDRAADAVLRARARQHGRRDGPVQGHQAGAPRRAWRARRRTPRAGDGARPERGQQRGRRGGRAARRSAQPLSQPLLCRCGASWRTACATSTRSTTSRR